MGEWITRGYASSLLLSLVMIMAVISYGAVLTYDTMNPAEAQTFVNSISGSVPPTALNIFLNNLALSIPLLVPMLGLIPFGLTLYNTGRALGAVAIVKSLPYTTVLATALSANPLEITAYAILLAENIYTSYLAIKGQFIDRVKSGYWRSVLAYLIALLAGALMEASLLLVR